MSLAEARQAKISSECIRVYTRGLSKCDIRDVRGAVAEMGTAPRGPGETAFPTLGNMLASTRKYQDQRERSTKGEFCHFCANTVHPGHQPVWIDHTSKITGKVTRISNGMRPCGCMQQTQTKMETKQ